MLPSTDLVSTVDNNNGTYCAEKDNEYFFKHLTLTPHIQSSQFSLIDKYSAQKYVIEPGDWSVHNNRVP